jgi:hypothetical protein
VTALPIIKHLYVFEGILRRHVTGHVAPMIHELALECPNKFSMQALSQQLPVRLMLAMTPWARVLACSSWRHPDCHDLSGVGPCSGCPVREHHGEGLLG